MRNPDVAVGRMLHMHFAASVDRVRDVRPSGHNAAATGF